MDILNAGEERKEEERKGHWEVCLVSEYPDENVFVWARDVVSSLRSPNFSHIPIECFATYFEWDPTHSEADLKKAPTRKATGGDVISFGIQRFKIVLQGREQSS